MSINDHENFDKLSQEIWGSIHSQIPKEYVSSTATSSTYAECKHAGWYHWVDFWIFTRKFLACDRCGNLIPLTGWQLTRVDKGAHK